VIRRFVNSALAGPPRCRHVAHILSSFGIGGQERVALDLASGQLASGYDVSAVSLTPAPDGPLAVEFRARGVGVHRVPRPRPVLDPMVVLRLTRWLRAHRVDLVHTHNPMALVYGAPAAWLAGAAVVHTKHGKNAPGTRALLLRRVAARFVDVFVAVSRETAEAARAGKEVHENRLRIIQNGIELDQFAPDPAARSRVRAELGIAPEAWVVGTVGRLAPEKNQQLLLRAVAPLLGDGVRVVIAGDGPLLRPLRDLAEELGVERFVHLLGARRDVAAVLNALDVFVLTSTTEGLPLVIPEAMAVGLPIIATAVGGVPGVVEDQVTGFLVDSEDELGLRARVGRLRSDPGMCNALALRARIASHRFAAATMWREYERIYEAVLAVSAYRQAR
jgi:glycosyltransferase involved in cell wall biosynthesis